MKDVIERLRCNKKRLHFSQVVMEGVIGSGFRGDIAIDDIAMTMGNCPLPGNCDFENGMCTWMNIGGDTFDWRLGKGATPSQNTGPNSDHTLGTPKGKKFIQS